MRKQRKKKWTYRAGTRPHTVTVFERAERGGQLYARCSVNGRIVKRSLGDMTRAEAVDYAETEAARMAEGAEALRNGSVPLGTVLDLYLREPHPGRKNRKQKTARVRKADERRAELWRRYLGPDFDPAKIGEREWQAFIGDRASGAIDARGYRVPEDERKPRRDRCVEADLRWLHAVLRWASRWRSPGTGQYLLSENPVRGLEYPKENKPRSAVVTEPRYRAMLEASDWVMTERSWDGDREIIRSPLREILMLANATGRRLSSILNLRAGDLRLQRTENAPHGTITFRAEHDKVGKGWTVPMAPEAREAVDAVLAQRPVVGDALLFPSPGDPEKPVTRWLANDWWRKAEEVGLAEEWIEEPMPKGRTFHGLRAKFATETQHLPDGFRAYLGGWTNTASLRWYDKVDPAGVLRVIDERGQLRGEVSNA